LVGDENQEPNNFPLTSSQNTFILSSFAAARKGFHSILRTEGLTLEIAGKKFSSQGGLTVETVRQISLMATFEC